MYYLESLLLRGFRNYHNEQLSFHPGMNLVIGDNAQGKTNLLESIYYLSVTRSFRTIRDQELANLDSGRFLIRGEFVQDEVKHLVQLSYQHGGKLKVIIDNDPANRFDHLQRFPVVVFSPDDLQMIKDGPSTRRRFINLEGSRLSSGYFQDLRKYQRILLQRNALLKEKISFAKKVELLESWNQNMAELGVRIIQFRIKLLKSMESSAAFFFDRMTGSAEKMTLHYKGTVKYNDDPEIMKSAFLSCLHTRREAEFNKGHSLVGPHLDDFQIMINCFDSRYYSSQGQKRTVIIALKMAEVSLFTTEKNICPIILLDDVFSEFDQERKEHLLSFLDELKSQSFISNTSVLHDAGINIKQQLKLIKIRQGRVLSIEEN